MSFPDTQIAFLTYLLAYLLSSVGGTTVGHSLALACFLHLVWILPDLAFSRLESWSRDVLRPVFTSLGLGLGLEPRSLGLGLGLGTSESWSRSWSWNPPVSVSVLVLVTPRTPNSDPWVEVACSDTYKVLHPLLESLLSACHLCSCGTDIQPQRFADAGKQG